MQYAHPECFGGERHYHHLRSQYWPEALYKSLYCLIISAKLLGYVSMYLSIQYLSTYLSITFLSTYLSNYLSIYLLIYLNITCKTFVSLVCASLSSLPICYSISPQTLLDWIIDYSSVQFSHSVVSDSLQPHGLQQARPPCPSPTLRFYPNSCPLSQ